MRYNAPGGWVRCPFGIKKLEKFSLVRHSKHNVWTNSALYYLQILLFIYTFFSLCTFSAVCINVKLFFDVIHQLKKVKVSSYIAQYPILRIAQSALHFTSLTDLFTQTPSQFLWEASSHMLQLMREGCSYTYPPLSIARSIARYSFA